MEALGGAGVCIGDWVEQHRRVLGTRRVVGPGLVLQAATVRASDEQLTFDATTTFAHIRVARQVFGEVTGSCLSDTIYPIMDANPNLLGCTLDFVNADTDAVVSVFRSKVSAKVGTRVTNFITPLFQDLDEGGKRKAGCQFSAQRAKKEEVPVIHHDLVFEVKDCASILPVFSSPSNGSTAWADPYYGFTTPFFYTSATVVAWPLRSADPLICSGDEPIESPEWVGFNESLPDLVRLEHCVLRATLSPSLYKLQTEVATLDPLKGAPIFNEKFPSIGRKFDSYERVQFFEKHHSIPINEWGEYYHDFPHLESVTTDIQTQAGLPLNIEIVAYVGALGAAQHWHRDFPRKVIPEGHHAFAVFFPLNYQLNGNTWIHGSSVGFPVPWVVREMDAGLGDAFVLNVCSIHRGGGLPEGVPPVDEISQRRNVRWVGFMLSSTTALPKNVTEGINPPFWAEDPSMTLDAPDVAYCGFKSCRKRPTSICYGCKKKVLCPTHKTQMCASCDAPVTAQDVSSSSGDVAMPDRNGSVSVDFPYTCFFAVGTTSVHRMWHPQKPRVHKARDELDCPCWEAMHGGGEIGTPTPEDSHLIRADAGTVLVWRHGRWGGGLQWVVTRRVVAKRKRRCLVGTWSPRNTKWSICQSCCEPVQRLKRWTSRGRLLRSSTGAHAIRFVLWGLQCGVLQCVTRGATSGGGLHEMGKGNVRAAIASEGYLSDAEVRLHNMHLHDQVFITKNDEHVKEISMKQ